MSNIGVSISLRVTGLDVSDEFVEIASPSASAARAVSSNGVYISIDYDIYPIDIVKEDGLSIEYQQPVNISLPSRRVLLTLQRDVPHMAQLQRMQALALQRGRDRGPEL